MTEYNSLALGIVVVAPGIVEDGHDVMPGKAIAAIAQVNPPLAAGAEAVLLHRRPI